MSNHKKEDFDSYCVLKHDELKYGNKGLILECKFIYNDLDWS